MSFIKIKNLDLKFEIIGPDKKSLRNFFKPKKESAKIVHTLKNINLEIKEGEKVGIIGSNGAGKSSLLRVMAQIYLPTSGSCQLSGQYNALLENDAGLQLDGSIIDNIYILLLLRGYNYSEIINNIDWIIEFSGLRFALDRPVRTFSTGMIIRLITSIMLCNKPEILILDEFFGTADQEFSEKVNKEFDKNVSKSGIFVCASHNHELLKRSCNRFIKIENGEILSDNQTL